MSYIKVSPKKLQPVKEVLLDMDVIYKNYNGNYYKGVVTGAPGWFDVWALPPNDRKYGIRCDFGGMVLIKQKADLFEL